MNSYVNPQYNPTVSTNSYTVVPDSIVDATESNHVKLLVKEINGRYGVTIRLVGRMVIRTVSEGVVSASDWSVVGGTVAVAAGGEGSVTSGIGESHFDQYAVQIVSTTTDQHGAVYVYGSASMLKQLVEPDPVVITAITNELWVDQGAPEGGDGSVVSPFNLLADALAAASTEAFVTTVIHLGYGNYAEEGLVVVPAGSMVTILAPHLCVVDLLAETGSLSIHAQGASPSAFYVAVDAGSEGTTLNFHGYNQCGLFVDGTAAPGALTVSVYDCPLATFAGGEVVAEAKSSTIQSDGTAIFSHSTDCWFVNTPPVMGTALADAIVVMDSCVLTDSLQVFPDKLVITNAQLDLEDGVFTISGAGFGVGTQTLFIDALSLATFELAAITVTSDFHIYVLDSDLELNDWYVNSSISGNGILAANGSKSHPFPSIAQAVAAAEASNDLSHRIHISGNFGGAARTSQGVLGGAPEVGTHYYVNTVNSTDLAMVLPGTLVVTDTITGDTWTDDGFGALIAAGGSASNGIVDYATGSWVIAWSGGGSPGNAVEMDFTPIDSEILISKDSINLTLEGEFSQVGTITFDAVTDSIEPVLAIRGSRSRSAVVDDLVVTCQGSASIDLSGCVVSNINTTGVLVGEQISLTCDDAEVTGVISDVGDPNQVIVGVSLTRSNFNGVQVQNMGPMISDCSFGTTVINQGTNPDNVFSNCRMYGDFTTGEEATFDQATQMKSAAIGAVSGSIRRGALVWGRDALAPVSTNSTQTPGVQYRRIYSYSASGAFDFSMPPSASYSIGEQIAVCETGNSFAITIVNDVADTLVGSASVQGEVSVWTKIAASTWARTN